MSDEHGPRTFGIWGLVGLFVLAAVSPTGNQPIALIAAATFVGVTARPGLRLRALIGGNFQRWARLVDSTVETDINVIGQQAALMIEGGLSLGGTLHLSDAESSLVIIVDFFLALH